MLKLAPKVLLWVKGKGGLLEGGTSKCYPLALQVTLSLFQMNKSFNSKQVN